MIDYLMEHILQLMMAIGDSSIAWSKHARLCKRKDQRGDRGDECSGRGWAP